MLVTLLIYVIVLGIIAAIINYIPMAQPFKTIAYLVVLLIAVAFLLQLLPVGGLHLR